VGTPLVSEGGHLRNSGMLEIILFEVLTFAAIYQFSILQVT
jgi:hypothetical protein